MAKPTLWTKHRSIGQIQRLVNAIKRERDGIPYNHIHKKRIDAELLEAEVFLRMVLKALKEG